jgi:hypothetical protein
MVGEFECGARTCVSMIAYRARGRCGELMGAQYGAVAGLPGALSADDGCCVGGV